MRSSAGSSEAPRKHPNEPSTPLAVHARTRSPTNGHKCLPRYLQLPPSLAKIRHEQLCREASGPVARALRSRGYALARDLLPLSKLRHLLGDAGAGTDETLAAVTLIQELRGQPPRQSSGGSRSPSAPASRETPAGTGEASKGASSQASTVRPVRGRSGPSPGVRASSRGKRSPPRISVGGLGLGGVPDERENLGKGGWDPRRYVSRSEASFKPCRSLVKRRWDDATKVRARRETVGLLPWVGTSFPSRIIPQAPVYHPGQFPRSQFTIQCFSPHGRV